MARAATRGRSTSSLRGDGVNRKLIFQDMAEEKWFTAEAEDIRLWKILSAHRARVRGSEVLSCTR